MVATATRVRGAPSRGYAERHQHARERNEGAGGAERVEQNEPREQAAGDVAQDVAGHQCAHVSTERALAAQH